MARVFQKNSKGGDEANASSRPPLRVPMNLTLYCTQSSPTHAKRRVMKCEHKEKSRLTNLSLNTKNKDQQKLFENCRIPTY